jgi:hypothetical protein
MNVFWADRNKKQTSWKKSEFIDSGLGVASDEPDTYSFLNNS